MSCQALKRHGRALSTYNVISVEANKKWLHLYDSNYMTFLERQNNGYCKKMKIYQGLMGKKG